MPNQAKTVLKAEFNPKIKSYLLWYTIILMVVCLITIPLIPFAFIIAPILIGKYFDRLHCELTTRSLKFAKGFIVRTEKTIPLDKIQDLTFKEGPLLRAFGLSVLRIETAGNSAQGISDLTLIGIIDAEAFRNRVLEQRDLVTDYQSKVVSEVSSEPIISVLKDIRDSLQRIETKLNN